MAKSPKNKAWTDKSDFARNLAVVIGIDRYQSDNIQNLSTAVGDAEAIAEVLEQLYGYKQTNQSGIIRLFNEQATLEGLHHLFQKRLPEKCLSESDRLIVYFAGHGLHHSDDDGPQGYLVPFDADPLQTNSFLKMSTLYKCLDQLDCHHLLVILDCCFAGMFRPSGSRKAVPVPETIYKERYYHFIRYPAWQVLTSSAHDQESLDTAQLKTDHRKPFSGDNTAKKHSPFALALLKGLKPGDNPQRPQADLVHDGVITVHELFTFLQTEVKKLSANQQSPGIYSRLEYDRGEFIFTSPEFDPEKLLPAPDLNEENNPYRGLEAFEEQHHLYFFGRKELVEKLIDQVSKPNHALTVVTGISGVGKSSLVKAGLMYSLRSNTTQRWKILSPMRPGDMPLVSLARVFLPLANPYLVKELSKVDFLNERLAAILNLNHEQDQIASNDVHSCGEGNSSKKNSDLLRVAKIWKDAQPETKLLLIEDYFTQLKSLGSQEDQECFAALHQQILDERHAVTEQIQQSSDYLIQKLKDWSDNNPNIRVLLVIDQFEELITMNQHQSPEDETPDSKQEVISSELRQGQVFLEQLSNVIETCPQQCHIVVTLRADFEPHFQESPLETFWKTAQFPVPVMKLQELRQVIQEPAAEKVIYFEPPSLVDTLISDVGQIPGALPLLSFVLRELYIQLHERWKSDPKSDRALRQEDYDKLGGGKQGGIGGALSKRANDEYKGLLDKFGAIEGKAYQATMRRVMLRMITIEGGSIARRRVRQSELKYADPEENKRVEWVLNWLVNARLLVRGKELSTLPQSDSFKDDVESYFEPAHDFLARGWDNLLQWKQSEEQNILLQRRLTPEAEAWKQLKDQENPFHSRVRETIYDYMDVFFYPIEQFPKNALSYTLKKIKGVMGLGQLSNTQTDSDPKTPTKSIQRLWNANPYLDVLNYILNSNRNWLNQLESEFVQQSVLQKRRTTSRNWRLAQLIIFLLLALTTWAFWEQRKTVISQISTMRAAAESDLRSNTLTMDPLINSLGAVQLNQHWLLQIFHPKTVLMDEATRTLREAYYSVRELERWNIQEDWNIKDIFVDPSGNAFLALIQSSNNSVCVWNPTNSLICNNRVYTESLDNVIGKVQFSPDGHRLLIVTKGDESTAVLHLWDWKTPSSQELIVQIEDQLPLVSFREDARQVAIVAAGTPYLWNLEDNRWYFLPHIPGPVRGIQFTPDGYLLLTTTEQINQVDGTVTHLLKLWLYDWSAYHPRGILEAPNEVNEATIHPKGERVVAIYGTASRFGAGALLWTVGGNEDRNQWERLDQDITFSFSRNDEKLATSDSTGAIKLRNWAGHEVATLNGHEGLLRQMQFSSDDLGQFLLTVGSDRTARLWDMRTKELTPTEVGADEISDFDLNYQDWKELDQPSCNSEPEHEDAVSSGSESKLGIFMGGAEGDTMRNTVDVWDCSSNNLFASVRVGPLYIKDIEVIEETAGETRGAVTLNETAALLAIVRNDQKVGVWDFRGVQLAEFMTSIDIVKRISFNAEGDTIMIEGQTKEGHSNTEYWGMGQRDTLFTEGCRRIARYIADPNFYLRNNWEQGERTLCGDL